MDDGFAMVRAALDLEVTQIDWATALTRGDVTEARRCWGELVRCGRVLGAEAGLEALRNGNELAMQTKSFDAFARIAATMFEAISGAA